MINALSRLSCTISRLAAAAAATSGLGHRMCWRLLGVPVLGNHCPDREEDTRQTCEGDGRVEPCKPTDRLDDGAAEGRAQDVGRGHHAHIEGGGDACHLLLAVAVRTVDAQDHDGYARHDEPKARAREHVAARCHYKVSTLKLEQRRRPKQEHAREIADDAQQGERPRSHLVDEAAAQRQEGGLREDPCEEEEADL
eukprot:CAMPEP_0115867656 /NCGR_PEP_ID=MMETSP0287-20121206/20879_1 /TAXON_ID=412157 /ORGANISM="Chrysochromulina rotalis, Strain UIO044" /LENGTH=195 /DNA_ID=CAMNT_0003322265 /DNA_START=69 /DNA_END=652 /DNA_ORIENTATION=+